MKVPFLDLHECFDPLRDEIFEELNGVFDRCDFVLGRPVKDFEEAVRKYCDVKYALGVANGSDALVIALRAAGIGEGDEVFTTPYTFIATAESIWAVGARPIFRDVSSVTYNLDPAAVVKFINDECETGQNGLINKKTGGRVSGILPVHLYGLMADMNAFAELGNKYGLKIIEDGAQSMGARINMDGLDNGSDGPEKGAQSGSVGDAGCFSFYPSKNLGGAGDGGMITTNSESVFELANSLHVHGASKKKYYHDEYGYNSRLDSIQAAILLVKLNHLDAWIESRRENASLYKKAIADKLGALGMDVVETNALPASGELPENTVALPYEPEGFYHTYNTFDVRLPRRDEAAAFLREKEIGCAVYYPLSLHEQKIFEYLGLKKGDLPVSETICNSILALPQFPELTTNMIESVTDTIALFYKRT